MAKKYYCVKVGRKTGIFQDVNEYHKAIRGYPGFVARGFNSLDLANEYMGFGKTKATSYNNQVQVVNNPTDNNSYIVDDINKYVIDITKAKRTQCNIGKQITAYVDGSYYALTNTMSYAVIVRGTNKRESCFTGTIIGDAWNKAGSQNAEFVAATEAIKFTYVNNCTKVTIVYDCASIKMVADGGKAKGKIAQEYQRTYEFISQIINIEFKKVNSHSSNSQIHQKYNNLADTAARSALSLKTKKTLQEHINKIIITH